MKRLTRCLDGMGIKKEDRVLIQLWGSDNDLIYLNEFKNEAKKLSDNITVVHHCKQSYAEQFSNDDFVKHLDLLVYENKDVVVDLMAESIMPSKAFSEKATKHYRKFMGEVFKRLMQAETFVQLRLPTSEMANSFGLDKKLYKEVLKQGLDVDYHNIKTNGHALINKFTGVKEFVIVTQKEKLTIRVDDRPWHNDCGNGDLPCGEVYTACIEDSANGTLYIE